MNDVGETDLIDHFREQLATTLGWGEVNIRIRSADGGADAMLDVPTPVGHVPLLVEVKKWVTPGSTLAIAQQVRRYADATGVDRVVVVAPWLSPASRHALTSAGVSWADATGNMRLQFADPPLLVSTQGADRNPHPQTRGIRGLGGHRAAEVVRALTELEPPFTLSELVKEIGTIDATFVSRILRGLANEGLIDRRTRGPVTRVDLVGIVERWVEDYSVMKDNLPRRYMLLGGPLPFLKRLRDLPEPRRRALSLTLTGSLAAYQVAPVLEPVTAMAYTTAPDESAAALGLVEAGEGANVVLLVPGNRAVLERHWEIGGVEAASPAVAAADMLSAGGRGVDEASALLEWAARNRQRWARGADSGVGSES